MTMNIPLGRFYLVRAEGETPMAAIVALNEYLLRIRTQYPHARVVDIHPLHAARPAQPYTVIFASLDKGEETPSFGLEDPQAKRATCPIIRSNIDKPKDPALAGMRCGLPVMDPGFRFHFAPVLVSAYSQGEVALCREHTRAIFKNAIQPNLLAFPLEKEDATVAIEVIWQGLT